MKEIALHVLDIVQNSITAGASRIYVSLGIDRPANTLTVKIEDNGKGMDSEMLEKVESPFVTTRTTRRVGLGIPLISAGAQATGGTFDIWSEEGVGTKIKAVYALDHLDRPPVGDFSGTMHTMIVCNPDIDFVVEVIIDGKEEKLDTAEVRQVLGEDVALDSPDVSIWIKDSLYEMLGEEYELI